MGELDEANGLTFRTYTTKVLVLGWFFYSRDGCALRPTPVGSFEIKRYDVRYAILDTV